MDYRRSQTVSTATVYAWAQLSPEHAVFISQCVQRHFAGDWG